MNDLQRINGNSVFAISEIATIDGEEQVFDWQRSWTAIGFCGIVHEKYGGAPRDFLPRPVPLQKQVEIAVSTLERFKNVKVLLKQIRNVNFK